MFRSAAEVFGIHIFRFRAALLPAVTPCVITVFALTVRGAPRALASEEKPTAGGSAPASAPAPSPAASPVPVTRFVSLPPFRVVGSGALTAKASKEVRAKEDSKVQISKEPSASELDEALFEAAVPYDYSKARFTLVIALASWSQRSVEVATQIESWQSDLASRKIKTVGVFTHDTANDIVTMIKSNGISFGVSKVSLEFVSKLLNPKVPTLWISDRTGQIVYRKERPSDKDLSEARQFLLSWTDF